MAECAPEAPSPGLAVEEAPGTAPWPGCSRSAESPLHSVPGCTSLGPVVLEAGGGGLCWRENGSTTVRPHPKAHLCPASCRRQLVCPRDSTCPHPMRNKVFGRLSEPPSGGAQTPFSWELVAKPL